MNKRGNKKITVPDIVCMKKDGKRFPVLTAYDYPTARILDKEGIPLFIVGDSVGMAMMGYKTTLPVTIEEMIYHSRAVARGRKRALVVTDMPFLSYQVSQDEARKNAGRLLKEGMAEAVKVEGGRRIEHIIRAIIDIDIPVMGHIGLTPQSVHMMGGYKLQGKGREDRERIIEDAKVVEKAGVFSIVLEGIPAGLAKEITEMLSIPTIGIGAGPYCDGQVLVVNDMLGINPEFKPRFVKSYANLHDTISGAVRRYIEDVEKGTFPSKEHYTS